MIFNKIKNKWNETKRKYDKEKDRKRERVFFVYLMQYSKFYSLIEIEIWINRETKKKKKNGGRKGQKGRSRNIDKKKKNEGRKRDKERGI